MSKIKVSQIDKLIGQRIQQCRKERKMTAEQLSEKIKVSQQQLSRYERATNKIPLSHLISIAEILEIPVSWFLIDIDKNVNETKLNTHDIQTKDLKIKFDYIWETLSYEEQKALVLLMDSISRNNQNSEKNS